MKLNPTLIHPRLASRTLTSRLVPIQQHCRRRHRRKQWYMAFLSPAASPGDDAGDADYLVATGIGVWGNNSPVGWAWDITNFVWWIGIGHAGTLISAILFLFRQKWRTSINRAAEAMTLFAVACAAHYPLFHTGRPWRAAYWLFPMPNTDLHMWQNFRRRSNGTCSRFQLTERFRYCSGMSD
ncbi:MAG: hypothetical protein QM757_42675 [Paludibaculum sp.]